MYIILYAVFKMNAGKIIKTPGISRVHIAASTIDNIPAVPIKKANPPAGDRLATI